MSLEDLKREVENKRRRKEEEELRRILRGQDEPVDRDVIYLTVREIAKQLNACTHTVTESIRKGMLKARKARVCAGKGSHAWVVHPDDFEKFKSTYVVNVK